MFSRSSYRGAESNKSASCRSGDWRWWLHSNWRASQSSYLSPWFSYLSPWFSYLSPWFSYLGPWFSVTVDAENKIQLIACSLVQGNSQKIFWGGEKVGWSWGRFYPWFSLTVDAGTKFNLITCSRSVLSRDLARKIIWGWGRWVGFGGVSIACGHIFMHAYAIIRATDSFYIKPPKYMAMILSYST